MDPITLATIAATLITTKAIEKVGEKVGEGGLSLGGRVLRKLRQKAPNAVQQLEGQSDAEAIDAEVIEEIRQAVETDPAIKADMANVAQWLQQSGGSNINFGKAANVGGVVLNQTNTF
jgi:hypothetical protein